MTSIGRYSLLVKLQRKAAAVDDMGGRSTSWGDVKEEWASISPFFSDQRLQAGGAEVTTTHIVKFRRDPGAKQGDRVLYAGVAYEIVRVKREPGKLDLEVWAREVVP